MVKSEKRIVKIFECIVLVIVPTINVRNADRERQHEGVSPKQSSAENDRHCEDDSPKQSQMRSRIYF
jgi:hypothetical protein